VNSSNFLHMLTSDIKVAAATGAATGATGLGLILDWIPNDIAKLGVLIGGVLSTVLICNQILIYKKTLFELKIMRRKEAERLARSADDD